MDLFFEKLADVCHDFIYRDKQIFNYLKNRNITAATINKYKLGAFPRDLRLLFTKMDPKELAERGIIWHAKESPFKYGDTNEIHYPIVIPIQDVNSNFIAIGCRTLLCDDERKVLGVPKYKNSEYKKAAYLYGLNYAINAIRKENKVFVVEGYFDVISCHQAGIFNVVATCGTLFSQRQLIILSRYTNNIILLFDNDDPGRKNSRRIMSKLANNDLINVNLTCQFTPNGYKDVDEYLCRGGDLEFFADNIN